MSNKPNTSIQMIADYEGDIKSLFETEVNGGIPILATRNLVLFPGVILPITVGRPSSLNLINQLTKDPDMTFAVFCQKNPDVEEPTKRDLYNIGVYAKLIRVLELPGPSHNLTAIVQGLGRCRLESLKQHTPYLVGTTTPAHEVIPDAKDKEFHTAVDDLRQATTEYIKKNDEIPDESQFAIGNIRNDVIVVDFICSNLPFNTGDKINMLKADTMTARVIETLKALNKEIQLLQLKMNIRSKTREDIDEQQREYFLQQQIRNIKEELGNGEGSPEHRELVG